MVHAHSYREVSVSRTNASNLTLLLSWIIFFRLLCAAGINIWSVGGPISIHCCAGNEVTKYWVCESDCYKPPFYSVYM